MKNFVDMVILGKMINNVVKNGKITIEESSWSVKKLTTKGKEQKVNAISESSAKFNRNLYPM